MARVRDLPQQVMSPAPQSHSRRRWAQVVSLAAAVAILAAWAGAWAPTRSRFHADGSGEPSHAAIKLAESWDDTGKASRLSHSHDPQRDARLVITHIVQLTAEKARLQAERDGATEIRFPRGFATSNRTVAARERLLFEARRAAIDRQKTLLGRRIVQVRHEVDGLLMQQRAREKEVQLFREELQLIDDMHGRKLANIARLLSLRRDLARSEGEVGGFIAQVARARAQIEEIELQIAEAEQKAVLEALKEIKDIDARIDELSARQRDSEDQPARVGPQQQGTRALGRDRKRLQRPSARSS